MQPTLNLVSLNATMKVNSFKTIGLTLGVGLFLLIAQQTISYTNNPPLARTGAPGESNCTGCHSGTAITSGTDFNNVSISTNMTDDEYIPDSTYKITVSYSESGKSKFGFMSTTLTSSGSNRAGSYTVTNSTKTARNTTNVNSKTREYIYHKSAGTSGSGGTSWDFEWTAPSKNEGDVKFYLAVNSTNNGNNSSGDKIILKNFEFSPSKKLPVAKITASTTICEGDTLVLDGTSSLRTTGYTWKVNGGAWTKNKKDSIIKAVWDKTGDFKVTLVASNGIGVSEEETISIKVIGSPSNQVSFSPNDTVCIGESVEIKALDGVSWTWSDNSTKQSVKVFNTGIYTLEVEGSNGCISTNDSILVTVLNAPTLRLSVLGNDTICETDSMQIAATSGFSEYNFSVNGLQLNNGPSNILSLKQIPGKYTIEASATTSFGCKASTFNGTQILVIGREQGPELLCKDVGVEELSIAWPTNSIGTVFQVSIDSGQTWQSANGIDGYWHKVDGLTYSTLVDFWVRGTVTDQCGYTITSKQQCKTKDCFTANFNISNDSVCLNAEKGEVSLDNLDLTNYSVAFNSGNYTKNTTFEYNPFAYGVGTHVVKVSIIDSNALTCSAYDISINFSVNDIPKPTILTKWESVNGQNSICIADQSKVLEGNLVENGISYSNTEWQGRGVRNLNRTFEFNPVMAGEGVHTITYEVTNIFGCVNRISENLNVDSVKTAFFTKQIDQRLVNLKADVSGAKQWKWFFSTENGDSSDLRNPSFYFNKDGKFYITLSTTGAGNVCPDVSYTDSVNVVGGSMSEFQNALRIYPNPVNNSLFIQLPSCNEGLIQLFNINGKLVYSNPNHKFGTLINTEALDNGSYFLKVNANGQWFHAKVVK